MRIVNVKITGETPFQVPASAFAFSPAETAITPAFSADMSAWTDLESEVAIGDNGIVNNPCPAVWWKLTGLASGKSVTVTYAAND